jgi:hypothetical protein
MAKVPLPPTTVSWHKSSASGESGCVEVSRDRENVWVRDSKDPSGPVLRFNDEEWAAFLVGARRGEFD